MSTNPPTLEQLHAPDRSHFRRASEHEIVQRVAMAWAAGWLPHELARQVRRTTDSATAALALFAIGVDHRDRDASTLHRDWLNEIGRIELPSVESGNGWLAAWEQRTSVEWNDVVRCVTRLLACLMTIGRLPIIVPPPGSSSDRPAARRTPLRSNPMLDRVRALLAQAESTTFEAEADTFTAKAQQLMTRHAIDASMLSCGSTNDEQPVTIRIAIDEPYVEGKAHLLHRVARHSRCRAAFHRHCALSSVVGFADDIAATEILFTSLLVQAQAAMRAAAAASPAGARARSRSFRSSFLVAYAQRVGERLEAINARVVADVESETGTSIVPVLAARSAVVDNVFDEMFGRNLSSTARRSYDAAGLASGRLAADRARLNAGDLAPRRRALPAE